MTKDLIIMPKDLSADEVKQKIRDAKINYLRNSYAYGCDIKCKRTLSYYLVTLYFYILVVCTIAAALYCFISFMGIWNIKVCT